MKNRLLIICSALLAIVLIASCAHRDCRGNKHRVKTDMGGYL